MNEACVLQCYVVLFANGFPFVHVTFGGSSGIFNGKTKEETVKALETRLAQLEGKLAMKSESSPSALTSSASYIYTAHLESNLEVSRPVQEKIGWLG